MKSAIRLEDQLEKVKTSALAVPASELAVLAVTGGDRRSWVNGLVTCDLATLKAGHAAYGLAVSQKGRILADVVIADDEAAKELLIALPQAVAAEVQAAFEHYLIMEDAEIAPAGDRFAAIAIHGPRAGEVLAAARAAGGRGGLLDRTGLGGAFVFAPRAEPEAARVDDAIAAALDAAGGGIGDDSAWEALRVLRAIPRFGVDFDGATYPQEAGLEKTAVSFSKGCYLGQEVVCMLEMRGHVKRKLVPLVVTDGEPPARGAEVTDAAGQKVGEVTSASKVPTVGAADAPATRALAMVKRALTEPGTELRVAGTIARVVAAES